MHGETYQFYYEIVDKWSKNLQGGDIFILDKAFVPWRVGYIDWTCFVIFMDDKLFQY